METQENRPARLTLTATEQEQRAVKAVALVRGLDVSSLLREYRLAEIMVEYERMADAIDQSEAA